MDLEVKRSIVIDKPVDSVWKSLWDEFAHADEVLSNVMSVNKVFTGEDAVGGGGSDGEVVTAEGISGRELSMVDGSTYTEMLVKVDNTSHTLSYSISGLPFGIIPVATWTVASASGGDAKNKSELILVDKMSLSYWPPRFVLYPVLQSQIPGAFDAMLADVKHYAETGKPSPAKVEATKKAAENEK